MTWAPQGKVSLARLTTWRIGGPADWYAEPETTDELRQALAWAHSRELPLSFLGRGSNVLISDDGLRGLVVCLRSFDKDDTRLLDEGPGTCRLEVSAGLFLPRLAKAIAQLEYSGYEFYIGIPGTVGGAVVMNAGFGPGDERQTANRCTEVRLMGPGGDAEWRPYAALHPVYRHTDALGRGELVVAARFRLSDRSTRAAIRAVTAEHLAMRKARQPLTRPTAGSVFKGTEEGVPAAVYIDRCGLKGQRVGEAMISLKHANWIENMGSARASDVLELIELIKATVSDREGITLETEVRFLH